MNKYKLISFLSSIVGILMISSGLLLGDTNRIAGLGDISIEEFNIQNPSQQEDCTRKTNKQQDPNKACCFERFRINKIVTTRCIYLENTEYAISQEKKYLQKEWGVKNLTILCDSGFLKYNLLMILILAGFIL